MLVGVFHVSFYIRFFFEAKIDVRMYLRRRRAHIINWLQASSIRQESRIDLFSLHKVCKWFWFSITMPCFGAVHHANVIYFC